MPRGGFRYRKYATPEEARAAHLAQQKAWHARQEPREHQRVKQKIWRNQYGKSQNYEIERARRMKPDEMNQRCPYLCRCERCRSYQTQELTGGQHG